MSAAITASKLPAAQAPSFCGIICSKATAALGAPIHTLHRLYRACNPDTVQLGCLKTTKFMTPLAKKRFDEVQGKIQAIAERAGITNPENIKAKVHGSFLSLIPCAFGRSSNGRVAIPPALLFQRQDLPQELSLDLLDSKAISEDEWFDTFDKWLSKQLGIPLCLKKGFKNLKAEDKTKLRRWLAFFRHPESERMLNMVLAHEISHISKGHTIKKRIIEALWLMFSLALALTITTIVILTTPTLPLLPILLLAIGVFYLTQSFGLSIANSSRKSDEIDADTNAAKILGDPQALIAYFKIHQEYNKRLRNEVPKLQGIFSAEGDLKANRSHPTLSERIADLRKCKQRLSPLTLVKV